MPGTYISPAETGLYYLLTRYYDPEIGRFINADSVVSGSGDSVQGYNLFAYCFNNPVNLTDETGNWPRWITATVAAVATVVAVVATVVSAPVVATAAAAVAVVSTVAYVAQSHHYDKRKELNNNETIPKTQQEAEEAGWVGPNSNPPSPSAKCHQYTDVNRNNTKYVTIDGHREAIYNASGDLVLDSRDIGTYNIVPSGGIGGTIGHIALDILPWIFFGNDDDDPGIIINTATYVGQEIIKLFD